MKRSEKLILVFGLIIAFGIAGAVILIITLSNEYTEKEVSLSPFKTPQPKEAIVTFFSGEVFYNRNDEWKPVTVGEVLKENDYIKTFENSYCEIQIGEKVSFSMRENALLKLYIVLQAEDKTQSDSEILIGTILYKVTQLNEKDEVTIRSGAHAFGIRGTEFFIDRKSNSTTCAVLEGSVAVLMSPDSKKEIIRISSNKETNIEDEQPKIFATSLSTDSLNILQNIQNMNTVGIIGTNSQKIIKTGIEVVPASAEIYINNQLVGTGTYAGLFPIGAEIPVKLRKIGYKDQSFVITAKQGENRMYAFKLELEKPEKGIPTSNPNEKIKQKIKLLEKQISTLSTEKESYRQEIIELKNQKASLEKQLSDANAKIKDAIKQLQ